MDNKSLTTNECKLIQIIKDSADPEKALEIAIDVLTRFLNDREGRA